MIDFDFELDDVGYDDTKTQESKKTCAFEHCSNEPEKSICFVVSVRLKSNIPI